MSNEKREQQMMDAADRYADEVCDESCTGAQVAETINDFCAGWRAADSYPNWISVEDYEKDELPSLMDKEDQYGCSVSVLFVVNLDGVRYINKGCFDYDTGIWHSVDTGLSYTKEQVTHWMEIVPPRKEDKQ